jgi:hypothetical protein
VRARACPRAAADRCTTGKRILTPAFALALSLAGEVEPARTLAEDTLQRSRRLVDPDHPITQYLTQAASSGQLLFQEDAAEDHPSRPL